MLHYQVRNGLLQVKRQLSAVEEENQKLKRKVRFSRPEEWYKTAFSSLNYASWDIKEWSNALVQARAHRF